MNDRLRARIDDQFSYRGERADIWRAFDVFLDTDEFLNLGYSRRGWPHLLGSPQRRLATTVGAGVAARISNPRGMSLLDVGSGRGGPALTLAERYGFDVTGVDLVAFNVAAARENANRRDAPATFVVGDATRLPFADRTFHACTAIDSIVYVPEKEAVFREVARVLRDGGIVGVSDLVVTDEVDATGRRAVDEFVEAWDMPSLPTVDAYRRTVERAGLDVVEVRDVSANSVGRFHKWTRLYLALVEYAGPLLEAALGRRGLDAEAITEQVRLAHAVLPILSHAIVYARR